jgi:phosphoenolpyruvate carboxykinase (GTP)
MRVLQWMLERIEGRGRRRRARVRRQPRYEDLDWTGLDFSRDDYQRITAIDAAQWRREVALHGELFDKLRDGMPAALQGVRRKLEQSLPA